MADPNSKSCDICFVYDTTGSMAPCLAEVRRNLKDIIPRLFQDIPNLRMSVVVHGDYVDEKTTYLMKQVDFTTDQKALTQFVTDVGSTNGGDYPEAYEYVLKKAQGLDWRSNDARCLVMIGDAYPHEAKDNPYNLDWRTEVEELSKMGINIYSVQCLNSGNRLSYAFWKTMAEKSNGYHLNLAQFSYVKDMMLGVAYKQVSVAAVENYQQEVQNRLGGMDVELRRMFDKLTGKNGPPEDDMKSFERKYDLGDGGGGGDEKDLRPVPPAKFQILRVDNDCKINDFVRHMGLTFKTGRGFYQFTKLEEIAPTKQVVLRRKATGELFQGRTARQLAKIPNIKAKVKPADCPEYDVFVQSTSANRKLMGGTNFLYEVPPP